jgi:hypothetical protein
MTYLMDAVTFGGASPDPWGDPMPWLWALLGLACFAPLCFLLMPWVYDYLDSPSRLYVRYIRWVDGVRGRVASGSSVRPGPEGTTMTTNCAAEPGAVVAAIEG